MDKEDAFPHLVRKLQRTKHRLCNGGPIKLLAKAKYSIRSDFFPPQIISNSWFEMWVSERLKTLRLTETRVALYVIRMT